MLLRRKSVCLEKSICLHEYAGLQQVVLDTTWKIQYNTVCQLGKQRFYYKYIKKEGEDRKSVV